MNFLRFGERTFFRSLWLDKCSIWEDQRFTRVRAGGRSITSWANKMIMINKSTNKQNILAAFLNIDVSKDTEKIAAARISDAVSEEIGLWEGIVPSTENQKKFAASLGLSVEIDSKRVAIAKIEEKLYENNMLAIVKMNLQPGDAVKVINEFNNFDGREFIISSIQSNGRVWFKGGNGWGAWASQLEKIGLSRLGNKQINRTRDTSVKK